MSDTKQVTGIVQSVTEATSVNGTFWKVALPPPAGLKYPQVFNIKKPEWMEGVKAGVAIALDVKRGRARKENPQYDSDYYMDVQGVHILRVDGPSDTGGTEPWPGEDVPTKPPTEVPKKPVAPLPSGNGHPKLGSEKLTPRERAMTLAIENWKGQTHSNNDLIKTAEMIEQWLTK